jgi:CubicO group peptidase (beta-lactamase class C family)
MERPVLLSIQIRRFAVLLISAATLPGAQAKPAPQPQPDSPDSFLRHQMELQHIPGMQAVILQHGKVIFAHNYGVANLQDGVPVDDDTEFPINSITKAFVGVAAMQLVEGGKLDLAAPVSRYLQDLPQAWQAVTILQLLTHTSGLPDIFNERQGVMIATSEDAAWKQVIEMPMQFAPGARFSYCQTNYLLIGRILDKLSGEPFVQLITEKELNVVGMPHTEFGDAKVFIPHSARDYHYTPGYGGDFGHTRDYTNQLDDFSPGLLTAAGMNSTAAEMARWVIALQAGKLFREKASLQKLWTPGRLSDGTTAGFSQMLNGYTIGAPMAVRSAHSAITPVGGGRSGIFIYPEDDLTIILLTNLSGAAPENFLDELAGYYIPELRSSTGFGFSPAFKSLHLELLKRGGYEHLAEAMEEGKEQGHPFEATEDEWEGFGRHLFNIGQGENAILALEMNTALHPEVADAYEVLAAIASWQGNSEVAKKNHQRFLELRKKQ